MYVCTYVHMYVHTYIRTYVCTYVHMYVSLNLKKNNVSFALLILSQKFLVFKVFILRKQQ